MSLLVEYSQALYDTEFSTALRESLYVFPVVEGVHLLALAFSVGLLALLDLRLIGKFLRDEPASEILYQLRPWILGGFAVTFISGALLFAATSVDVLASPVFPIKVIFIFLAGINALWFEFSHGRHAHAWAQLRELPSSVRFAGWASLILWFGVVVTGRLIPYLR